MTHQYSSEINAVKMLKFESYTFTLRKDEMTPSNLEDFKKVVFKWNL